MSDIERRCALPACGQPFGTRHPLRRYCSGPCSEAARVIRHRVYNERRRLAPFFPPGEPRPRRTCAHCGAWFVAASRSQTYCNLACSSQAVANRRRRAAS